MPKKFDRCVKKVRAKNKNVNPYAICHASMNKKMMKDKGVNLHCNKQNIGRRVIDREGNEFIIDECHSGFVWLRGNRGLKQISKEDLKYYHEKKR